ncbi:hypothetical protein BGZ47_002573, partial [Haplosporangium gracile]
MTRGPPTQQHATGDGDSNHSNTPPPRRRDKFLDAIGLSKLKRVKDKASNQSLNTQASPSPSVTSKSMDNDNQSIASSATTINLLSVPPTESKAISDIFPKHLEKPEIKIELPVRFDRIEATLQLVYCNRLIRDGLSLIVSATSDEGSTEVFVSESQEQSPTASQESATNGLQAWNPNEAERTWIKGIRQDPIKQDRLRWLVTKVVDEFVMDPLKGHDLIAEVVLVGPVLDYGTYRRLLSCFIGEIEKCVLLDFHLLQGLVQLIEDASPGYLEVDDLLKTLTVLRHLLHDTHRQSSAQLYQITIAISRLFDVMVNGSVSGINRVEQYQPFTDILRDLSYTDDPIIKFQADYALQASQYIPNDESIWQAVLRFGGGVAMAGLGPATVGKLNPVTLFESLDELRKAAFQAAGQAYEISKSKLEGMDALQKGSYEAMQSLLHTFRKGSDYEWYLTLLAAKTFVRDGRLAEFNQTVCEARCRDEKSFQLGVCQILGEIAMDPLWDAHTRQHAVEFLGALSKTATGWKQHSEVKQWIVVILTQLSGLSAFIKKPAFFVLQNVQQEYATATTTIAATLVSYSLKSRLSLPVSSPLLIRVQNTVDIEYDMRRFRDQRLRNRKPDIYIPPMAKADLQASDDTLFPLMNRVKEFLANERQVMLILGDSGVGKSTFNRNLEMELWESYTSGGCIPLFINLPAIDNPVKDLMAKQLREHNFSDAQIQEMKQHRQFVVICDGYDESQLTTNLHTTNLFNRPGQWNVKMVISCRTQYLGPDYLSCFEPQGDRYSSPAPHLFDEAVIVPFSKEQIQDYVKQYVPLEPRIWRTEDFMDRLTTIPNLLDLVSNPFLLSLALEALPRVTDGKQGFSSVKITRVQLYDIFVDRWLSVSQRRLQENALSSEERVTLEQMVEAGFISCSIDYSTRLASAIFEQNGGNPVVQYSLLYDRGSWRDKFFGPQPEIRLLREASLLTRTGNRFRFVHRSILEYFFSRAIYNPVKTDEEEFDPEVETLAHTSLLFDEFNPLFQKSLLTESSIIQFLCDRVNLHPEFEQQLRDVIEQSKTDANATIAATNAITILVKAGANFNSADLRDIKIPGANLSGGQFDSAQFQGADLRNVNLAGTSLRQANLSGSLMEGVQYGADGMVQCCAYLPDGKLLVMGLPGKWVEIYDTSSWKRVYRFRHDVEVLAVAFSPDGSRIVSGGEDGSLQLWDCNGSGNEVLAMTGHAGEVTSVAFSPCSKQVASASSDKTVRLWDSQTGKELFVLDHTYRVNSVKFSPNGRQLASGSGDRKVRFWDPTTGESGFELICSLGGVCSLAYSPDGRWIASGHLNGRLQLWNIASHEPGPILQGHTDSVKGIAFSPDSKLMASSSKDRTVRLWDASTGAFINKLEGHGGIVFDVAFTRDGSQVASASDDKTGRMWEVSSKSLSSGQKDRVGHAWKAAYSPNGRYIISSDGSTVQQRNATTGAPGSVSFEFSTPLAIECVAFSLNGKQIVTGHMDNTVRLWDRHTSEAGPVLSRGSIGVSKLEFSPCCRWIVSVDNHRNMRMWDLLHPDQLSSLVDTDSEIRSVAFSPSGHQFALGSYKGDVLLFDPESRALLGSKKLNGYAVSTLAYSPNGQQLAVGFEDYSICLWDLQPDAAGLRFQGHKGRIICVAYSSCGQWIASGSEDKTLRIWRRQVLDEVESWSCVSSIQASFGYIRDAVWNPAGLMEFVTVCSDDAFRAWRVSSSEEGVAVVMIWDTSLEA